MTPSAQILDCRCRIDRSLLLPVRTSLLSSNPHELAERANTLVAMGSDESRPSSTSETTEEPAVQMPIYINVYRLAGGSASDALLSTLAGGGLYHSGIEVGGAEYAFGGGSGNGSGMWRQRPRSLPSCFANSSYKETVDMGLSTPMSPIELRQILIDLAIEWRTNQYHVLHRNWCVSTSSEHASTNSAERDQMRIRGETLFSTRAPPRAREVGAVQRVVFEGPAFFLLCCVSFFFLSSSPSPY